MLTVRVIKKYHNEKGILIGYRIKSVATGEERDVYKDQLKTLVANGAVAIDNMTLTSDGRLIGHATPKSRPNTVMRKEPEKVGITVECVFTNGRKIACAMVNKTEFLRQTRQEVEHYKGLNDGISFEVGFEATSLIKSEYYDNIKLVDGKPDFSKTKKKSYKQLKEKLLKILSANDIHTDLTVKKEDKKYEYSVSIDNYDEIADKDVIKQIIYILIENAMYNNNLKALRVDEGVVFVNCMTGINDVRKALKTEGINKI